MSRWPLVPLLLFACHGGGTPTTTRSGDAPGADAQQAIAVPVRVAEVRRMDLPVIVSGPGRTAATESQVIRAPFDGVLLDLTVTNGDDVEAGQVLGWFVSRDSEAALAGARQMMQAARTARQRRDARRALTLAQRGLVKTPLRAAQPGIVLSHEADEGARLTANQPIVTVVSTYDIAFICQIAQADLARVEPGQSAAIELASSGQTEQGTVHAVLPGGSATDLTAPVSIDFPPSEPQREVNLFGVAHITVGVHVGAVVVPKAAVLRNDVTGVSRVATVGADEHAHWIEIRPGLSESDVVEVLSPPLAVGTRVVTSGLVGLPEGAPVRVQP